MLSSPFKLTYRYSPLTSELTPGLKRELRFIFGDHVRFDPAVRAIYARDAGALPADLVDMVLKRKPYAVVLPRDRGDLVECLRLAERHGLPVTPRGNGTSTNGAAIPSEGGIAVDMRAFRVIHGVDEEAMTVACEPGVTFAELRTFLEPHGLAPLMEPELPWASTVGGSVALGRVGIGSARWGDIGQLCVAAEVLTPDRRVETSQGEGLELVRGLMGSTGFLVEVTLKVGPREELQPFLAQFEKADGAAQAFRALQGGEPYHVQLLTPDFVAMRQEASGVKGLQEKHHVLAVFPKADDAHAKVLAAAEPARGKVLDAKNAEKEWGQRSAGASIHRLGPTVVTAECVVPSERLAEALRDLPAAAKGRQCTDVLAVGATQALVRVRILEDERRMEFPLSLGNLFAVVDAAHRLGGRAAYPSLLLAGEAKRCLGEGRWQKLATFKKHRDPAEIMNPGKAWPARMRGMPFAPLPTFLRTQKPLLKLARGAAPYKGQEADRPADQGMAAALGRARAGGIAEHADELYTCSHCGLCNTVSPAVDPWESGRPRGVVMVQRALLEGEGRWTERVRDAVLRLPLHRAGDAVCPSKIPLQASFVAARTEVAQQLGPHPAHEALAASVAKHGNPLGKPKAERGAWLPQGFVPTPDAKVLYYAGCRAAYDRPAVALAGLELLRKVGPVNTLGAAEPCCGHTLWFTGQRDAAAKQAEAAMKALAKTGCEVVVTPDAACALTMKGLWPQVAAEKDIAWTAQVKHAPEHLFPLVGKGLALTSQVAESVHFTEPCCAPDTASLKLLQKVPGLQVASLPILPCGGPGGMREASPEVADACAHQAMLTAKAAGATRLVTSHPQCEVELGRAGGARGITVEDTLVLVARAAGIALPGQPAPGAPAPAAPEVAKPAPAKLTPEELEARKKAALEKAAAMKAAKGG